jgi:hypothetical protein
MTPNTEKTPRRPDPSPTDVYVSFGAVCKQLRRSPEGVPILRMLVSGTKLDTFEYDDPISGVHVVGEKVMPELLASMATQAKVGRAEADGTPGRVYLLENHHATLPMGEAVDGVVQPGDEDNLELFVDFALDEKHPDIPFLISKLETDPNYHPQCSIGLMVRRQIQWDQAEGGYVGQLVEGRFEHVALTRPGHAAYPDADLEEIFLAESLAEVTKSLVTSTARHLAKFMAGGTNNTTVRNKSAKAEKGGPVSIKIRNDKTAEADAEAKKTAEAEEKKKLEKKEAGDVHVHLPPPAPPADPDADAGDADDADADADDGKEDDDAKEDEDSKEDNVKEDEDEAEDEDEDAAPPSLAGALGKARKMVKDAEDSGADAGALTDMLSGIGEALEEACAMAAEMEDEDEGGAVAKEDEDEAEDEDDDTPATTPPAPPAKKPAPPAAAPKKDPKKGLVMKKKQDRQDQLLTRLLNRLEKIEKGNQKIERKLANLDKTPATPAPSRFNAPQAPGSLDPSSDEFVARLKSATPKERQNMTEDLISRVLSGQYQVAFPGLAGKAPLTK